MAHRIFVEHGYESKETKMKNINLIKGDNMQAMLIINKLITVFGQKREFI